MLTAALLHLLASRDSPFDRPGRQASLHLLSPFGDSVYRQEAYFDQLEPGSQCRPKSVFPPELPTTDALTNMALAEEVKKIAAEFEYTGEDVNKGVRHFIHQMEEGLANQGTELSQIPTYVTSVPNGTEKVYLPMLSSVAVCLMDDRAST